MGGATRMYGWWGFLGHVWKDFGRLRLIRRRHLPRPGRSATSSSSCGPPRLSGSTRYTAATARISIEAPCSVEHPWLLASNEPVVEETPMPSARVVTTRLDPTCGTLARRRCATRPPAPASGAPWSDDQPRMVHAKEDVEENRCSAYLDMPNIMLFAPQTVEPLAWADVDRSGRTVTGVARGSWRRMARKGVHDSDIVVRAVAMRTRRRRSCSALHRTPTLRAWRTEPDAVGWNDTSNNSKAASGLRRAGQ